jgi:hypothetical protein
MEVKPNLSLSMKLCKIGKYVFCLRETFLLRPFGNKFPYYRYAMCLNSKKNFATIKLAIVSSSALSATSFGQYQFHSERESIIKAEHNSSRNRNNSRINYKKNRKPLNHKHSIFIAFILFYI